MPPVTIFENDYITLLYHPEHKTIHHIMQQPIHGQPLRDALMHGTEALRKYGANKWLSDDRKNAQLSAEDNEWAQKEWFAQTLAAGWEYWAFVVPTGMEGQLSMINAIQTFTQMGVTTRVFTDSDKALAWLESV